MKETLRRVGFAIVCASGFKEFFLQSIADPTKVMSETTKINYTCIYTFITDFHALQCLAEFYD